LVKFWLALLHAPAKPALMTNEPVPFATLRFVKMAAVPWLTEAGLPVRAPTVTLPIPAPAEVMTLAGLVVDSK